MNLAHELTVPSWFTPEQCVWYQQFKSLSTWQAVSQEKASTAKSDHMALLVQWASL